MPGRGPEKADCLASRVQKRYPDALIVHRLDMETSGLLLMARGPDAHRILSQHFEKRRVAKRYCALVEGFVALENGEVDLPLGLDWPNRPKHVVDHVNGKPSLTRYQRLSYDQDRDCSRLALEPVTGRSHQLRVHMLSLGHPMLGDTLYASPAGIAQSSRLLLHAEWLAFPHPFSGERCEFSSPAPF